MDRKIGGQHRCLNDGYLVGIIKRVFCGGSNST